jgi:localization factor PodJL
MDRLAGLTDRLGDVESEIPGFDALRENQTAILERFDRMEGIVQHLLSPDELIERIDGLRRQLQASATQREAARIEEQILGLADRLESLPETLGDRTTLERIETQLQALAGEFAEARRQRAAGAHSVEAKLDDISAGMRDLAAADRAPDLSGVETRLDDIAARLDGERRAGGEALGGIDRRLAALAAAIDTQQDEASAEILAGLSRRMEQLADAIEAQDVRGARRDIEGLGRKLDELSRALAEQSQHLSRAEASPVEQRLAELQSQLADFARRAQAPEFGPFAQKLQDISDRLSGLPDAFPGDALHARLTAIEERLAGLSPRGSDNRALHNQLESIVSRLEVLKGRSIDPARLNELFDRVDAAIRTGALEERFDRIERKIEEASIPAERFDRLERRLAEGARAGLSDAHVERIERRIAEIGGALSEDRLIRLEDKLDDIVAAYAAGAELMSHEELAELRGDIGALRRELRSLPGLGEGQASLGTVLQTISQRLERLPDGAPATTADLEAQIDRVARLIDDPAQSRLALAHIESSLKSIEKRLDETRRTLLGGEPVAAPTAKGEISTVAGLARALSDDVTVLKTSAEASEKKTKDALDAVQDTLEAVVKRMAFLERDADATARAPGEPVETAAAEAVEPPASEAEPAPPEVAEPAPQPKPETARESAP